MSRTRRGARRPARPGGGRPRPAGRQPAERGGAGAPHERAGAAYFSRLLGNEVGWLVGFHVLAKRALVTTDPGYLERLSPVSVRSLAQQGGPAAADETARFLRHPSAPVVPPGKD